MTFDPNMAEAVSGQPASSAEYNKVLANILDHETRLADAITDNANQDGWINSVGTPTATNQGTRGSNGTVYSEITTLKAKTVTNTKQALSTNSTTVASTTEVSLWTYTFSVTSGTNKVSCIANFDVSANSGLSGVLPSGEGCMIVKCYLDGAVQTAQIVFGSTTVLRLTAGQSWDWSNLASGNHTIEMRASLATQPSSNPSYRVYGTHTGFTLTVFNGQ